MRSRFAASILVVMSFVSSAALAVSGESSSGTRGGGDPKVLEFLGILRDLTAYLERSSNSLDAAGKMAAVEMRHKLEHLMDDSRKTPIQFTSKKLTDDSGTEKFALFSKHPLKIIVNREAWLANDLEFKTRLVALELFGLIGVKDRYAAAASLDVQSVEDTRRIRASGWDFTSLFRRSNFVGIENPYVQIVLGADSPRRPFAIERGQATRFTIDVLCHLFGFSEAIDVLFSDLKPKEFANGVTLFDATGTMTLSSDLKNDISHYQVFDLVTCRP